MLLWLLLAALILLPAALGYSLSPTPPQAT